MPMFTPMILKDALVNCFNSRSCIESPSAVFVSKEVLSFFDWSKGFHFNVAYTVKADIFFSVESSYGI